MSIKILGVKVYISYLFVAMLTLMFFFDRTGLILPLSFAVFVHETAHLIAMKKLNCAPSEIMLIPGSIRIINPKNYNISKENIILICGPLVNIIFFILFLIPGNEPFLKYSAVQLTVALFNLLPSYGLDGGALLYNFLILRLSSTASRYIYFSVSLLVGLLFVSLGIIFLVCGEINPSFLILGIYIIVFTFVKM